MGQRNITQNVDNAYLHVVHTQTVNIHRCSAFAVANLQSCVGRWKVVE